jgi:hypothetical protein
VLVAIAYTGPLSNLGWNQGSHYALVRAIWRGSPSIDEDRWLSGDVAFANGHFYSTKAPGLALASMPEYAVLRATGLDDAISARSSSRWQAARIVMWLLGLGTVILPAAIMLLLVSATGDRIAPGWGLAAAVTLGLGTLVLPFATMFFAHVLSALLGFAAFALLWWQREEAKPWWVAGGAGLSAGLAVVTEYSMALIALTLGGYALLAGRERLRRGVAYNAGLVTGVAPLLIYNAWAFGSPVHLSYANAVSVPGSSGHDVLDANTTGFFGVGVPSPRVALELLLASRGLLTLSPVLLMSGVGAVLMFRRGWRAESLVIGAAAVSFLVFNAGYFLPFGGWAVGPRFLIPSLPFLAVPLALAYRRFPATTLALAVASAVILVTATATRPLLPTADIGEWATRLRAGLFRDTLPGIADSPRQVLLLWAVPALLAIVLTMRAAPYVRIGTNDVRRAFVVLGVWGAAAILIPRVGAAPGSAAIVLVLVAATAGATAAWLAYLASGRKVAGQV